MSNWFGFLKEFDNVPETTEEEKELMDKIGGKIVDMKLTLPAIFMLESARPLNFISSQFMIFMEPVLSIMFPKQRLRSIHKLLEKRENLDYLLRKIDTLEDEADHRKRASAKIARQKKIDGKKISRLKKTENRKSE